MGFEDAEGGILGVEDNQNGEVRRATMTPANEGLMTLRDLIEEITVQRRALLIAVAVTLACAVVYLVLAPTKYEAYVKIAPAQDRSTVSSTSEGVLSSIGLDLGAPNDFRPFDHLIETLTSAKLAKRLNEDDGLAKRVFPFDEETGQFVRSKNPVALLSNLLNWLFGQPGWTPPESHELAKYLESRLEIEQDRETSVVTIKYLNRDRDFAEQVLSSAISKADEILRNEERSLNLARHAYLDRRLETEVRQMNRALVAELLLDSEQRLMLANVDPMFGARIVDGPTSSKKPASPRVMFTLVLSVILGFMLGISLIIVNILLRDTSE